MGGDAYSIPGVPHPRLWQDAQPFRPPGPHPPFWRRLLGAKRLEPDYTLPRVVESRNGDRHFELSRDGLAEALVPDLRRWIAAHVPAPSPSSAAILDYLRDVGPRLSVRGLQRAGQAVPEFWIQFSFSGCAGEAEVSARVATHWTALWHRAEHERIAEVYLIPFGLTPEVCAPALMTQRYFLPPDELGYLEYTPAPDRARFQPAFELDHCMEEAQSGHPVLERLFDAFGHYMTEGRCRCQICEPAFAGAELPQLR